MIADTVEGLKEMSELEKYTMKKDLEINNNKSKIILYILEGDEEARQFNGNEESLKNQIPRLNVN